MDIYLNIIFKSVISICTYFYDMRDFTKLYFSFIRLAKY